MAKRKRVGPIPKRITKGEGAGKVKPPLYSKPLPTNVWQKVYNQYEAFSWNVRSLVQQKEWRKLRPYLADWWRTVYGPVSLPEGGVRAIDIYLIIQYELLAKGHEVNGVTLPEKVNTNLKAARVLLEDRPRAIKMFTPGSSALFRYEEASEFGQLIINFTNEETIMAAKKKTAATAKKSTAKKSTAKKSDVAAASKALGAKKGGKKTETAPKEEMAPKEKKLTATAFCIELLLKEEFTDSEIMQKMAKQFDKTPEHYKSWPASYRRQLAEGKLAKYGVVEVAQLVEEEEEEE